MTESDATYHRAPNGDVFRIFTEHDPDASSPREDSTVSTLLTAESRYHSPDDNPCDFPSGYLQPHAVELRRCQVYAALFLPDVLYVTGLERGGWQGEQLVTSDRDSNRLVGIAYIKASDWADYMGDSPIDGNPSVNLPSAREAIEQELTNYNAWASGEYVGFIVEKLTRWVRADAVDAEGAHDADDEMTTWETHESVWGFDDEDYALTEAAATLPAGSVKITRAEATAASVPVSA